MRNGQRSVLFVFRLGRSPQASVGSRGEITTENAENAELHREQNAIPTRPSSTVFFVFKKLISIGRCNISGQDLGRGLPVECLTRSRVEFACDVI